MLIRSNMNKKQWKTVRRLTKLLQMDYQNRKELLLKRLDFTIDSMLQSPNIKSKNNEIDAFVEPLRTLVEEKCYNSKIGIPDLLSSTKSRLITLFLELLAYERVSFGVDRVQCDVNKVQINDVPDRGGRMWETSHPPTPETFSQQQNQLKEPRNQYKRQDHGHPQRRYQQEYYQQQSLNFQSREPIYAEFRPSRNRNSDNSGDPRDPSFGKQRSNNKKSCF
ncbi:protein FAM98A-like [Octopus sinensis]|uniref:Protein FAM98A-like n=1 Tax=Octopus sinensis TaxID=2607531 RepID=A0A7E6EI77_9MOLL|nr:protein FAM98A-like [Octopus sinensis]